FHARAVIDHQTCSFDFCGHLRNLELDTLKIGDRFAECLAFERKAFGKTIADFQGIQFQIAQMATEIEAARLMVYNCARMKDAGVNFVKEAAMTKLFASQVAERVTSLAIEIYGGY